MQNCPIDGGSSVANVFLRLGEQTIPRQRQGYGFLRILSLENHNSEHKISTEKRMCGVVHRVQYQACSYDNPPGKVSHVSGLRNPTFDDKKFAACRPSAMPCFRLICVYDGACRLGTILEWS
ncbi:predicted protein [Coccidioides posadasii str. Silveira]|uniref:Predicted protein n=1 Tax=Coccidioides posadasii (strain RMSCC 757 / Silveira) TaxID=443226 RepID=E9CSF2_COCPS|nr:predicted protein [Coccidioides posadasii str. Silveira]